MKRRTLLTILLVGCAGGLARAQEPQCSAAVGNVHVTVTDPAAGTANADATCVVAANFAAIITPTVKAEPGFKNPTDNHWTWTATIDGKASKSITPDEESTSPITVTIAGVTLSDRAIEAPTKVATVIVTITEDVSKSFFKRQPGKTAGAAWRPTRAYGLRKP